MLHLALRIPSEPLLNLLFLLAFSPKFATLNYTVRSEELWISALCVSPAEGFSCGRLSSDKTRDTLNDLYKCWGGGGVEVKRRYLVKCNSTVTAVMGTMKLKAINVNI